MEKGKQSQERKGNSLDENIILVKVAIVCQHSETDQNLYCFYPQSSKQGLIGKNTV